VARHQQTIRTLNQLIRIGREGEHLCTLGAATVHGALARVLRERGEEWGRVSDELQALVLILRGAPATNGTFAARARHRWIALHAQLFGSGESRLLRVWEQLERHALECYWQAAEGYLPARIRRTLCLQAERILRRVEQASDLREHALLQSPTATTL
jgi:uncharacterized protein (TIGR02284 family)